MTAGQGMRPTGTPQPPLRAVDEHERPEPAARRSDGDAVAASSIDEAPLEIAYVHDGTLEGLLSAVFAAFERRENPSDVASERTLQPRLGQRVVAIETDVRRALRVKRGIERVCGPSAFDALRTASLSDAPDCHTAILRFTQFAMSRKNEGSFRRCGLPRCSGGTCARTKRCVFSRIADEHVEPIVRYKRAVDNERHRMLQFLRFEHLEGGIWYARCHPAASVVPLLMGSFSARFNVQPFIIHDEAHGIAGVYDGRSWYLVPTDGADLPDRTADEIVMQRAWRRFYRSVSAETRYHPELRRQLMPKRLWADLTELREEIPADRALPEGE